MTEPDRELLVGAPDAVLVNIGVGKGFSDEVDEQIGVLAVTGLTADEGERTFLFAFPHSVRDDVLRLFRSAIEDLGEAP